MGVGDCESYKNANGEVFYDNQGSNRVYLEFVEQSTKVKRGKKYIVVQGRKETLWIDKATTEFENESYAVRVASSLRVAEERGFDRNMANDQPFLDYVDNDDYDSADDRSHDNHSEDGLGDVNVDDDENADDNNGEDLDVHVPAERAQLKTRCETISILSYRHVINSHHHIQRILVTRTPSIPGIPGSGTNVRTVRIEDDPIHTICCVISAVLICKLITLLYFSC